MPVKFVNFLKRKLIFNTSYCFWMFVNKLFTYADISKSKRCFIAEFSTYYFHMKAKMLGDFHQNDVNHSILVSLLLISNRIYTLQQSLFQNCNNKRWAILNNLFHTDETFIEYDIDFSLLPSLNKELEKSYPWKFKKNQ